MTGGTDNMSACPYAVRDIRFGTKLGSEKVFRLPKSFLSIEGEKSIVCISALSRLESFGVKIDCQKDELKKY